MAAELYKARLALVDGVNQGLLKGLIDGLRHAKVLNEREENEILQAHQVTQDRTGKLIDMVHNKGDNASFSLIAVLEKLDLHLAAELGLIADQIDETRMQRMDQS